MKKLLLTAAALLTLGFANAQEEPATQGFAKGDVFITGAVGFTNTKTGDIKTNTFNVAPKAAYFVTSNIAVGLALGYSHSSQDVYEDDYPNTYKQKINTFSAGAFGRYYFTPTNKFSFFGQLSASFDSYKNEVAGYDSEYKTTGFSGGISPGISYFVSNHFALEATLGALSYNTVKPKSVTSAGTFDNDSTNTFSLDLNLSTIYFGAVYKF